jgi:surface carbohydrate biosynthesis protein
VPDPMSDDRTPLILPVENQVREFDAKLLLACLAAERGFPVVMGSRALVHHLVSSSPRGVYLAKSLRRLSDKMFGILDLLGHDIVAWDEEALVQLRDPNFYYRRRLSPRTLRLTAALFAWGAENEALFRGYPGYDGTPIYLTGNPRSDMMRPELRGYYAEDIERIHKRYDRFVLVNTNFGWNNHFLRAFRLDQPAGAPKNDFEAGLALHRTAQFESFQQMLPALARALPDHTILIRPHPTEDHEIWRQIARDLPNARVDNEGNVVPWLMACETLIHVGCTTAVDAAVIGTPAINYQSACSLEFDPPLPYQLSHHAFSLDQLLEMTRAAVAGGLGAVGAEGRRVLAHNIAALDGSLASERMLDALEGMGYAERRPERSGALRYSRGWIENQVRTLGKKINMRRSGHRNSTEYHDHRYPGVTLEGMWARVARLRNSLGRFDEIRVRPLSEHIYRIES